MERVFSWCTLRLIGSVRVSVGSHVVSCLLISGVSCTERLDAAVVSALPCHAEIYTPSHLPALSGDV